MRRKILRLYFGMMRYCLCFPYEWLQWREPVETQDFASHKQWCTCFHYVLLRSLIALGFLWDARFCVSTLEGCVILKFFTMSLLWGAGGMYVGMKGYGMGMSWCVDITSAAVACALVTCCVADGMAWWRRCINMQGCRTVYAILYMVTRNRACFYAQQWRRMQIRDFYELCLRLCVTVIYVVWCVGMTSSVLRNIPFDVAGKAFRHAGKAFPEHW